MGIDDVMYLSKFTFVRCNDLLSLSVAAGGDQIQDGFFVTAWEACRVHGNQETEESAE